MALSFSERSKIKVKAAYRRVVLTRITAAFFLFSLLHCFGQGIINAFSYTIDSEYAQIITEITSRASIPTTEIPDLEGSMGHWQLSVCNDVPYYGRRANNCTVLFDLTSKPSLPDFNSTIYKRESEGNDTEPVVFTRPQLKSIATIVSKSNNSGVDVLFRNGSNQTLDARCTRTLLYAQQVFRDFRREDLVWVALQFWIFAISFIAILYDSIPHTFAVLGARILMTSWSSYNFWRTSNMQTRFEQLYIDQGTPCHVDLGFTDYFNARITYDIPDVILNCTALLISVYMSWTLLQMYRSQTFKRIGAPPEVLKLYKYFMAVLVCLQLGAFILMAAVSLWIDELRTVYMNTSSDHKTISDHTSAYLTALILTSVVILPMGTAGWIAIKKEKRRLMVIFLFLLFALCAGWASMFYSQIYRWTFMQWPLLASMTVASYILIIASFVLGIVCRMNFGKGLAHYLYAEDVLSKLDFAPGLFSTKGDTASESQVSLHTGSRKSFSKSNLEFWEEPLPMSPTLEKGPLGGRDLEKGTRSEVRVFFG